MALITKLIKYLSRLWQDYTEEVIVEYQEAVIEYVREGYDERTVSRRMMIRVTKYNL